MTEDNLKLKLDNIGNKMKKQTKTNLYAISQAVLFTTPLIGDIFLHRYWSKRRTINLEQRVELEKTKTEFKKVKNLGNSSLQQYRESFIEYREKLIENMEFLASKKVEAVLLTAKYFAWTPMAYCLYKSLF